MALQRLREAAEKAKIELSSSLYQSIGPECLSNDKQEFDSLWKDSKTILAYICPQLLS
jgi:molecular chaperone DnaK (HSP70)